MTPATQSSLTTLSGRRPIRAALALGLLVSLAPGVFAMSQETTQAIVSRGIPRADTYYPRETGVRGDIKKITTLQNGELGILTSIGVFYFDGTNWERVPGVEWATNATPLADGNLAVSSKDGIVALAADGLGGYDVQLLTPPERYNFGLPPLDFAVAARGQMFGQAGDKLVQIMPNEEIRFHKLPNWSSGSFVIGEELYFLGGTTSLLNRWDWTRDELVDCTTLLDEAAIYEWTVDFAKREQGGVWLITEKQNLIGFDGSRTWAWPGNENLAKLNTKVKCIVEIAPGSLAIGTSSQGLLVFDETGELAFQYSKEHGLDDVNIVEIGLDSQKGIWIATQNSLTRLPENSRTVVFDENHGLPDSILSIAFFDDRVFVGTAVGLFASRRVFGATGEVFERVLDQNDVGDLRVYDDHLFIAGSRIQILNRKGEIRELAEAGGTTFWQPSAQPEVMLAGNYQGVLRFEKKNGIWETTGRLSGPEIDIYSLIETAEGVLLGSTGDDQIARIELDDTGGSYSLQQLPRYSGMWSTAVNVDGDTYVNGTPCLRWDPTTQTFVEDPQMHYYVGLIPYGYEQVYGSSDENAFVAENGRRGTTVPRPSRTIIGDISSLGNAIDTRALCIAYDEFGNVWSGGPFGLTHSRTELTDHETMPMQPRIHRFVSLKDGVTLSFESDGSEPLILGPDQNSLRIEVEFPSFTASMHNQFQIYVEGLDRTWADFNSVPFREITNLAPGAYAIYINAHGPSGKIHSSETVHFTLRAPWYQRPWAYALFSLAALLLVTAIALIYSRAQIQRGRKLEKLVQERTHEIESKNLELKHQAKILERQNYDLEEKTEELQSTTDSLTETLHQLHDMQDQLVATARTAGKAEIATNVLHNVGNVLNSINVSLTVLTEKVSASKVSKLSRLAKLVESHMGNIENFLTQDQRGKKVPNYLIHVADALREEITEISYELNTMEEDIDHVKRIIAAQQSHAKSQSIKQDFNLRELCDTAFTILGREAFRSDFEFASEIDEHITLCNDKHRVLEILLNLISNAQDAIRERGPDLGFISVIADIDEAASQIIISITDNGVGIDPENQSHLFTHGFTTKADGHGFGLHGSANAAQALGGQLRITSPGRGKGATATLTLPIAAEPQAKAV